MSKNGSIIWRLRWNATLTSASWGSTGVDAAAGLDTDVAASAVSGGEVIGMGFAVSGGTTDETMDHRDVRDRFKYQTRRLMRDPFDPTTVYDSLTITAEKVNSGSTDVYAMVVIDRT